MKEITIIIDGKTITAQIDETVRQQLLQPVKRTGYERMRKGETYYYVDYDGQAEDVSDTKDGSDDNAYNIANYYSDFKLAQDNARADKLMRQLRRFAVEHREKELDWNNVEQTKWYIEHMYDFKKLITDYTCTYRKLGTIYFDTKETAQLAIDTFKDELLWYFTEYKDSL